MSEHVATIIWTSAPHADRPETYSRDHTADFGFGNVLPVSAAADYLGNARYADPEQLLVNALASCHMLYFLALCEGSGYKVARYSDRAVGTVSKAENGGLWVSTIELAPQVEFAEGKKPDEAALHRLHERAHRGCFIANSIKSKVSIAL